MNILKEQLKIASIHATRLEYALENLKDVFPLSPDVLENMPMENLLLIELLMSRLLNCRIIWARNYLP